MAITEQLPRNVSTAAPGATVFPYNFKVLSKSDLAVRVNGVAKAADVDFTVTGVGAANGGNITFLTPLAGGESVARLRRMAFSRETDYQNLGDLRSASLNNDQDAPVMMLQQLDEEVGRSMRLSPELAATVSVDMPGPAPGHAIGWNADGTALRNTDLSGPADLALRTDLNDPTGGSKLVQYRNTALAGALARTLESKLLETVSVLDFIPVAEHAAIIAGTTLYDATANVQSAINAATAARKELFVPQGLYLISARTYIPTGARIVGAGKGRAIFRARANLAAGNPMFLNTNATGGAVNAINDSDITMRGVTIDGAMNAGRTEPLMFFWKTARLNLIDNEVCNTTYQGCAIYAGRDPLVSGNWFHDCGKTSATPEGGSALVMAYTNFDNSSLFDATCESNLFTDNRWCHSYYSCIRGSFSFNTMRNSGESAMFGSQQLDGIRFIGNTIEGTSRVDIAASGLELNDPRNCILQGNVISKCGSDGISIIDGQNIKVIDNICKNNGQQYASYSPFANASGIGIASTKAAPNHSRDILLRGNSCYDDQGTKTQRYGVQLFRIGAGSTMPRITIDTNSFNGNAVGDIYKASGSLGAQYLQKDNAQNNGVVETPIKVTQVQAPVSVGTQAITGIGFRPRAVRIVYGLSSTTVACTGQGVYDGTAYATWSYVDGSGRAGGPTTGNLVYATTSAAAVQFQGTLASLDEDGITLNWTNLTQRPWLTIECIR